MAKSKKEVIQGVAKSRAMWADIEEDAFLEEKNIEQVDIADYSLENMTYYFANTNYFRQMIRLSDGLKPVVRRILHIMHTAKAYNGARMKSGSIVGDTLKIHAHSDMSIYEAMVGLAQEWKTPVPLIEGKGNFGNIKGDPFAAYRYTEAGLSKYGWECFFSDYDPDCIEELHNTAADTKEPMTIPSKFPNILVNGGTGFAPCNAFKVPPYNIMDIITNTKKVLVNPDCGDIYMIPDLPTGCPIVEVGNSLDDIAETGTGTIRMRADIEIREVTVNRTKCWALCVQNIPWRVSLRMIDARLRTLKKSGQLPFEEAQDHSYVVKGKNGKFTMQIDYRIILNHSLDPYAFRKKLYKLTELEKGIAVDLKAVVAELKVRRFPMKALIQAWIDERRSYKRRLYNKKIVKLNERIALLEVLIRILDKKNYVKTMDIIRSSRDGDFIDRLCSHGKMTKYQAMRIGDTPMRYLTAEALERYKEELPKKVAERDEILEIVKSERRIDVIIADELDDLKKYATPRKSRLIRDSDEGEYISDTMHNLVVSNQGFIKKLPFYKDEPKKNSNLGAFAPMDYPICAVPVHNRDSVLFFDSHGRYSTIPIHMIDNCEPSSNGHRGFDITKLTGKIVEVIPCFKNSQLEKLEANIDTVYLITLTADGYLKKTKLSEYLKIKSTRNIRGAKVREGDSLVFAAIMIGAPNVIIYTKKGKFLYTSMDAFEPTGKDTAGLMSMKMEPDDSCIGIASIPPKTKHIAVITEKGLVKKCEIEYLGDLNKRRASPSYLITLDSSDRICSVCALKSYSDIVVTTTHNAFTLKNKDIPVLTRKAKGSKMIPVPLGAKIIRVSTTQPTK